MPTTGTPRRGPLAIIDLKPFSHDGMNSRGIAPPLISSANSKSPSPRLGVAGDAAVLARAAGLLLVGVVEVDLG
jgi:hypothetical protein